MTPAAVNFLAPVQASIGTTGLRARQWPGRDSRVAAMNANVHEDPRVDLVFEGQVLEGFDADQVKRAIGDFFKLDAMRRERMFLGAPYVVKRDVTRPEV